MMSYQNFAIACLFLLSWLLVTKAWFWCALAAILGIAALFSMLKSIIHFQILAAAGFLFLWALLWLASGIIYESKIRRVA